MSASAELRKRVKGALRAIGFTQSAPRRGEGGMSEPGFGEIQGFGRRMADVRMEDGGFRLTG
ncbi:hypothetical protein SY85_14725 [Flavisolibacter tropicus]|uniref:Uncharacterized protein n=1 Tax=Flavisolibacter tropicus TaxID=1492898 RepID=A0A172TWT2_9BACT|nr:hypothetical protein SY85_14725 [Flavisolibacter tropicus]